MNHLYEGYALNRREAIAMELFDITPVILGGNSTDPANKILLTREQHIQAVRYWNRIIRDLRK